MFEKYVALAHEMGAMDAVEFGISDIAFDERTILKCMFGCKDYGFGHTCPSRKGSLMPWDYRRVLEMYKGGIIIHSQDKRVSQNVSLEIEKCAFLDGFYMAFSMSDCAKCGRCAGFSGKPCTHPVDARPAFHSVGIDVFRTVRRFDLSIETLKEGDAANWYSAVFID